MWPGNLTKEELKTLQSLFRKGGVVGAITTDYMEFICTTCGKAVDMTYQGGDPMMPYFTYNCECGNRSRFKINPAGVHNLPLLREQK